LNLAHLMRRAGRVFPDLPAVFLADRPVANYRTLARRVAGLAGVLQDRFRLAPGDRVALAMSNTPEYVEILFACWHAGLMAVPMNPRLHPKELAFVLENSGARLCFATADLAGILAPLRSEFPQLEHLLPVGDADYARLASAPPAGMVERRPTDGAWLFYTSGTTGRPKGAELSHRNIFTMTGGYFIDFEPVAAGDRILHIGPMCHGSGFYILPHVAGGAAQVIPAEGFKPAEVFALIEHHPRMSFFAAPTIVKRLAESPEARGADVGRMRTIIYGGAPMYSEDLKRALHVFGPKLAQVYGQGESPMAIAVLSRAFHAGRNQPRYEERLHSVGVAQSIVDVRIVDGDDRTVASGELGEVIVRGDTVMTGYWNNPEASAEALRGGWLHTGDIGIMDEDGYLTLKDRSKDVIISGGSNIYPREVEEILLRHPAVAEVSVIGLRDTEWGESVVAFVACAPGQAVSAAELDALCIENIARYKRPKLYRFLENLPKSHIGKTLKTELRRMLAEEARSLPATDLSGGQGQN